MDGSPLETGLATPALDDEEIVGSPRTAIDTVAAQSTPMGQQQKQKNGGNLVEGHLSGNSFYEYLSIPQTCASPKRSRAEASLCGLAKVTDLTKLWTGSQWEYKLHQTRTLRNLREHEGHYLNRDLPLSDEGLICFKIQKPRKTCEVQYLCSDPTGNAKGKCTYTPSTSSDL